MKHCARTQRRLTLFSVGVLALALTTGAGTTHAAFGKAPHFGKKTKHSRGHKYEQLGSDSGSADETVRDKAVQTSDAPGGDHSPVRDAPGGDHSPVRDAPVAVTGERRPDSPQDSAGSRPGSRRSSTPPTPEWMSPDWWPVDDHADVRRVIGPNRAATVITTTGAQLFAEVDRNGTMTYFAEDRGVVDPNSFTPLKAVPA